jgi:hypothetical protein
VNVVGKSPLNLNLTYTLLVPWISQGGLVFATIDLRKANGLAPVIDATRKTIKSPS